MACPECEKNKKKTAKDFTKAVVEIKNPDKLVLFRKVVVPASMGTEEQFPASVGKFSNVLLQYEANGDTYLYSSDGIPTQLSSDVSELQRQLDELKIVVTNEIADRIAADGTINSRIDQEILDRQAADNDLSDALAAEVAARKAADNTLDGKITTEKNARIAADNTLQTNINNEATARAAADSTLDGKITTEKEAREAADRTLQTNINNEATTRANADTALGTRITNETTARQNADSTLDGKITTEANTRSAADSALAEDISAEVTRAKAAETALGGRIDDEATARAAADTTLDGKITTEATARANADSTLDGKITDEATARANADTALGTRITDETTARTNADTAINNKLNRTVLYDLEMQTDANNVTFVEDKINLGTGATTTERDVIPAASTTTAGTISASEYISLVDAEEKITALLEGAVAIDNLPANPTQQQLTNAWLAATGKTELINRASIYDSANQLVHTYYTNVSEWEDSPAGGQITIDQFTNSAAGIIKGSTTDGNVSANLDGTGTVSGWTALKNTVAGKANSSDLATVATSGSYDDLSNKPTIPTVNNATLTIQKNGTTVKTFTANASTNVTANITVPTKTSDLTNDSNFPVDANYVHTDNNFTTALKNKLDGIAAGAEVNQNAFSNVKVGSTTVAADSKTDTLELATDGSVTLTPDATNDKVTISVPTATTSVNGLMSAADKTEFENLKPVVRKLYSDGTQIPANADLNTPTYLTVGRYGCGSNATVATLVNCPTNRGFMMDVYNTIDTDTDDQTTASWTSRIRKILDYLGREWVQTVEKSGGTITYSSWENVVYKSAMDTELAKKVNVASIDITDQTTTLLALTKALGTAGMHYARWICKTGIGSANIPDKPISANNAFVCVAYATRWNNTSDYQYELLCYVGGANRPYAAIVANSTSSISWGQEALTSDIKDATLTIQKNGTTVQTFTANSSTNKTANITVPTKVTDLTDAANYVAKDGDFYVTGEGSNFSMTGTSQNVYADLKVKGDTQQTTYTGKNLCNGVSQGYFINVAANGAGKTENDSGLAIAVQANTNYTVSTTTTQARYRVAVLSTLPTSSAIVAAYNGINKDDKSESITINSGSYTYLVVNATDLSAVQIETGSSATSFEPYVGGVPAPNPDYPQEVEVVTGRQVISSSGKNICSSKTEAGGYNNSTGNKQDVSGYRTADKIPVAPNTEYIWSDNGSGIGMNVIAYDISGTYISQITSGAIAAGHSFTTPANCYYVTGWRGSNMTKLQLENGSTITAYTPCQGPLRSYEINLGKNLFNRSSYEYVAGYYLNNNGVLTAQSGYNTYICPCDPNTTYTISWASVAPSAQNRCRIGCSANKPSATNVNLDILRTTTNGEYSSPQTVTTSSDAKWLAIDTRGLATSTLQDTADTLQVEKGSTASSYSSYFTPIELCKIGTYQDYLYPSNGKWYLHKKIGKMATTGDEVISLSNVMINIGNTEAVQGEGSIVYSTHAIYKWQVAVGACYVSGGGPNICIGVSGLSSSADAQNWVATNKPVFYYRLKTPTDTEITNPLLVAQLDDLWRNLQSGTNTTNVNVEGDLPAILGVTAFTNTLASAMAGINERMNRLPAIPQITMTSTDPGEGQTLADNHYIAVYE